MDGEVNVSDDSQNYLPTPGNEEEDSWRLNQPDFERGIQRETQPNFNPQININDINKELSQFNLDDETKAIFKYMSDFVP